MSKKVEEYIENYTKRCSNEDGFDYVPWLTPDQARRAVEIAREEAMEEARKGFQWISVKDRLPEEEFDDGYTFVFVVRKTFDGSCYYDTDYIRNGKWNFHDDESITHWMPIPPLLEGDTNK